METSRPEYAVLEAPSLRAYFYQELEAVFDRQGFDPSHETRAYMVNLLHQYGRSDQVFEWYEQRVTLRPLAMLYGEAVHARNLSERRVMLRRLGDIALFIAGLFSPSLERKTVGVDYYINMGGSAYDCLSDSLSSTGDRSLCWRTFRELAENFQTLVAALDHFADSSGMRGHGKSVDLLRKWQGEASPALTGTEPRGPGEPQAPDLRTCH